MQSPSGSRVVAIVLAALLLTSCGAAAPARSSTGSTAWPASSSGVTSPVATSTTRAPTTRPTLDSTPAPIVLDGTWVRPKEDASLTSYRTTLSARPTATGDGVTTFTRVVFSASWTGGKKKVVCKATRPNDDGVWSCTSDLLARGVPPGTVAFSFDVFGVGVQAARSPGGLRRVSYAVPPPRPTDARLQQIEQPDYENGDNAAVLHRVRWSAPTGYADEFALYETFECPRPSTERNNGKPCFVAGTPVDTSRLELRATAPGDARSLKVRLTEYECGPSHGSLLLRARNSYGKSVFAIVASAPIIWVAPDEIIC